LSDLSLLYFYEHKFAEAEQLGGRALAIDEKAFGPEGLQVSTDLNRVGIAQRDEGKVKEAENSLKRALAIREKQLPRQHQWIAVSLENLASVYLLQGKQDKAAPLIARARIIRARPQAASLPAKSKKSTREQAGNNKPRIPCKTVMQEARKSR